MFPPHYYRSWWLKLLWFNYLRCFRKELSFVLLIFFKVLLLTCTLCVLSYFKFFCEALRHCKLINFLCGYFYLLYTKQLPLFNSFTRKGYLYVIYFTINELGVSGVPRGLVAYIDVGGDELSRHRISVVKRCKWRKNYIVSLG